MFPLAFTVAAKIEHQHPNFKANRQRRPHIFQSGSESAGGKPWKGRDKVRNADGWISSEYMSII
jgi:hypothetical protein